MFHSDWFKLVNNKHIYPREKCTATDSMDKNNNKCFLFESILYVFEYPYILHFVIAACSFRCYIKISNFY